EKAERQARRASFPAKKSGIDLSLRQAVGKEGRILTGYHHVNVGQLVAQDAQGFGHPGQFVSGEKAQREAWLGGTSGAASSFGCGCNLREHPAGVIEKGPTSRRRFAPRAGGGRGC